MKKIVSIFIMLFFVNAMAVQLKLKLNEGDKFDLSFRSEQIINLGQGDSVYTTKTLMDAVFEINVLKVGKENAEASYRLKKAVLKLTSPSGTKEFDTEKVKDYPSNPLLAMYYEVKNTPLIYVFSLKDFKVVKIKNLETIFANVLKNLKIEDEKLKKKTLKALRENSKKYFNSGYNFGVNVAGYLNRDIEEGKSFKVSQEFTQGGIDFKVDMEYTPKKIDERFVYFALKSSFTIPFQEMSFNGMKLVVNLKGNQEGDLTVYRDCGLPKFFSVKQKLKGNMAQKGAGEGFPLSIESIFIIRYKKVK